MQKTQVGASAIGIPEGYVAIPVSAADEAAALRVCVLARQTPDPAVDHLVVLRDLHDAVVYLGCIADAAGRPREWIELWVQNIDGLETSLPAYREMFSNHALDARWAAQAQSFCELDPGNFIQTGWESAHPSPCWLDLSTRRPVRPSGGEANSGWELCLDDEALRKAGLPAYGTSLFRYLYQRSAGEAGKFIPIVGGAPQGTSTVPVSTALEGLVHPLPLNPQAGLLMALGFAPLSLEDYADLLGGKPWTGLEHGKKKITFDGLYNSLTDPDQIANGLGHIFLGLHGRAGRWIESYHLKLQLLADAVRLVRAQVEKQQLPFLNLSADSFRVALRSVGNGFPALWTARPVLVKPSCAFGLPVETSELRYFIRVSGTATSVYLPEGLSAATQGVGSVLLRKVLPPDYGTTIVEGTLRSQEHIAVSPNDLLWIRLPLQSGRLDLYGHLYASEGLAQGEARFRTAPQKFSDATAAALKAAEGISFARSPFEVVPMLSSPCDLYSLAVLATRVLLVDDKTTLAVALDEMLSLARQVGAEPNPDVPLGERIRAVFERDARYQASLGPHRLSRRELSPEEAFQLLPRELWYDTLGVIVRLLPGAGPDSACRDYGDVPALALETVFNKPLEELDKLVVRSRSLILIDWNFNREINGAIRGFLAGS